LFLANNEISREHREIKELWQRQNDIASTSVSRGKITILSNADVRIHHHRYRHRHRRLARRWSVHNPSAMMLRNVAFAHSRFPTAQCAFHQCPPGTVSQIIVRTIATPPHMIHRAARRNELVAIRRYVSAFTTGTFSRHPEIHTEINCGAGTVPCDLGKQIG